MKDLRKGTLQLLHDTPACHADYISVTGSDQFDLPFCGIRWVEDQKGDMLYGHTLTVLKVH